MNRINSRPFSSNLVAACVIMLHKHDSLLEDAETESWEQKVDKVEEGLENIEKGLLESHVDHNKTQKLLKLVTKGQRDIEKNLKKLASTAVSSQPGL